MCQHQQTKNSWKGRAQVTFGQPFRGRNSDPADPAPHQAKSTLWRLIYTLEVLPQEAPIGDFRLSKCGAPTINKSYQ